MNSKVSFRFMLSLAKTEKTHCNECSFCYNELTQIKKPWLLMFTSAASLYVAVASLYFDVARGHYLVIFGRVI